MSYRRLCLIVTGLTFYVVTHAHADTHSVKPIAGAPDALAKDVAESLNPSGILIDGGNGPVCEIWITKQTKIVANFKPTLSVKYPFRSGELLGALRIPKGADFTDFRGQEVPAGVYTLRYGRQPVDGNHIGTSELADFLLAIPAAVDKSAEAVGDLGDLYGRSAETAGSSHPAIFSLLPSEPAASKNARVDHDDDRDFLILSIPVPGRDGSKDVSVPIRLVVVGESEG